MTTAAPVAGMNVATLKSLDQVDPDDKPESLASNINGDRPW